MLDLSIIGAFSRDHSIIVVPRNQIMIHKGFESSRCLILKVPVIFKGPLCQNRIKPSGGRPTSGQANTPKIGLSFLQDGN